MLCTGCHKPSSFTPPHLKAVQCSRLFAEHDSQNSSHAVSFVDDSVPSATGGLQLSLAGCLWNSCKVAGCQQTKCVNLQHWPSFYSRPSSWSMVLLARLVWLCHGASTCLHALWSELVPAQTPHRKKTLAASPTSVVARGACAKPQCASSYLFSNCLFWRRFAALQTATPMFRLLLSSAGLGSALASPPDKTYASALRIYIR